MLWSIMLMAMLLSGCTDLDEVNGRLDRLETQVTDLQTAVALLQKASEEGKVISEVVPIDTGNGGWEITFSDGTAITLLHGADGADGIISSLEQDEANNRIIFTLADGQVFAFNLTYVAPTGISVLAVRPVFLGWGGQASIEFRVNPSNANFNYNVESDQCEIGLDCISSITRSSYVAEPVYYKLASVEQVYDESTGEAKQGQFRALLTDLKQGAAYDEAAALVLTVADANGNSVQLSSSAFEVKSSAFEDIQTGLPIVVIDTPDAQPITSKTDWMADVQMSILDTDGSLDYQGTLSMKGRGNTTWGYPKKPYALKLDSKSKILGMKKHKRWCLLANWMDRTLIRNAVAFEISRKTGLDWTPNGKFVELVLNGRHVGNYWLCEQIKVDENRVNVTELDINATEGDAITGGYVFELDVNYDELYKFKSDIYNLPWQFKDPDEVNEQQFLYVQNYVHELEDALTDPDRFAAREFTEYMELESFVDYWFVYELAMNWEPNHPKSAYMNKDMNGKLKAGPVWDFDYGTFKPFATRYYMINNALYYKQLFQDALFKSLVKERWNKLKAGFESISQFIDVTAAQLVESDNINIAMWPISSTVNGDEKMTYEQAVARLKKAYEDKLKWMDAQIQAY